MLRYAVAMACLSLCLLAGFSAAEAANRLATAQALRDALMQGETVTTVLDLGKCTSARDATKSGTMKGGLRIASFLIRPDNSISFADDHFTVTTKDKRPIYQFLRYQIMPDDTASFSMTTMSLPDYRVEGEVLTYNCKVNEGMSFFAQ